MPLYEYRCKKCDHLEEVLQSRTEPAPNKCPECGARKSMAREMSLTSFQLKGGGWYNDLYGSVPDGKKGDSESAQGSAVADASKSKKGEKKATKKTKKKAAKKSKSKKKSSSGKAA